MRQAAGTLIALGLRANLRPVLLWGAAVPITLYAGWVASGRAWVAMAMLFVEVLAGLLLIEMSKGG